MNKYTKKGEIQIGSMARLFEVFYEDKYLFIKFIQRLGKYVESEDAEDIFEESLILLVEKYFNGKAKTDYTELRMILFKIARIKTYQFISRKVNENCLEQPNNGENVIYTPHQLWFKQYYREYTAKNRQKIRDRNNSPKYRAMHAIRQKRLRDRRKLKNI